MSDLTNLIFLSTAFFIGLVMYTMFLIIVYRLFIREPEEDISIEVSPDEKPLEEQVDNMEEIAIDV